MNALEAVSAIRPRACLAVVGAFSLLSTQPTCAASTRPIAALADPSAEEAMATDEITIEVDRVRFKLPYAYTGKYAPHPGTGIRQQPGLNFMFWMPSGRPVDRPFYGVGKFRNRDNGEHIVQVSNLQPLKLEDPRALSPSQKFSNRTSDPRYGLRRYNDVLELQEYFYNRDDPSSGDVAYFRPGGSLSFILRCNPRFAPGMNPLCSGDVEDTALGVRYFVIFLSEEIAHWREITRRISDFISQWKQS